MTNSKVATRYARALLELAIEQGQQQAWGEELVRLASTVTAPELFVRLTSPELPEHTCLEAMGLIGERLGLSFPLRSFALVVARHGRLADLAGIAQAYQDQLDRRLGRARAVLTFYEPPAPAQAKAVVDALSERTSKEIIATVKIEPALLGGVVAEVEGRIYDASLATAMARLEQRLSPQF